MVSRNQTESTTYKQISTKNSRPMTAHNTYMQSGNNKGSQSKLAAVTALQQQKVAIPGHNAHGSRNNYQQPHNTQIGNNTMATQYSNIYEQKIKEYLYTGQSSSQASQKALPGSFTAGTSNPVNAKKSTNLGSRPQSTTIAGRGAKKSEISQGVLMGKGSKYYA